MENLNTNTLESDVLNVVYTTEMKSKLENIKMNEIDLHQVKHTDAEVKVEDYVLTNDLPIKIITGNSEEMKKIVEEVLKRHGFEYRIGDFSGLNTGYITVDS